MTAEALWRVATDTLRAAGIADPRREARRLARPLGDPDTGALTPRGSETVEAGFAARYLAAVGRRAAGEPLAHVVGWTGFRHLVLGCDRRALIPRPETEGLVELALARVSRGVAADVGTGTGAIALSLAAEGEFDEVIGCDLSPDALALAGENAERCELSVTWLSGDMLAPLAGRQVDLLVSNPPYLTSAEHAGLDPAVRDWEPALALIGGEDGLDPYRRLLADAPALVVAGGWLVLEVDARRARATADLVSTRAWRDVAILDDLFGRARYLVARRET
jgi:release factor glutamine methyltransferase